MINIRKLTQFSIIFLFLFSCINDIPKNASTSILNAPTNLSSTTVSSSSINLSWTDNSDSESGFRIERASDNGGSAGAFSHVASVQTNTNSYNDTGLNSNTKYYFRVNSYNIINSSGYSNIANATTNPPPITIPNSPSGLTANTVSSSGINLAWVDNSNNEEGFRVERAPDNGGIAGTFSLLTTVATNINSYNDTGLSASTKYYYRIRAYNSVGNSGYSNEANTTTQSPPVTVPNAPTNLISSAVSSNAINLSWTDNSNNEEGFTIERAVDNGGSAGTFSLLATVATNINSYNDTGLSASTKYYYRIRAYNSVGDSGYSNETSATTQDIPPPTQIIADHTVVDKYDKIPQYYKDEVKKMWVSYAGESHSSGVRIGADLLELLDSTFQVNVTESGTPEAYTNQHLRLSRATWGDYDNASGWRYSYGEEDWFTSQQARDRTKAGLTYCHTNGPALSVLGFGWCWDHGVYSVSDSINQYLSATQEFIDHCLNNGYNTKVIFTTGPVDGYTGEAAYLRYQSSQQIRSFVAANPARILFDYADILSWNDEGEENRQTYNGNPMNYIHPDNMMDYNTDWTITSHSEDGDHIGEVGALRLAKAMWWMLARITGWDGQ